MRTWICISLWLPCDQSELAEHAMGDSKDIHVIRATAYGRVRHAGEGRRRISGCARNSPPMTALSTSDWRILSSPSGEYRDAIGELQDAEKFSPDDANIYALLARSYANLHDREQTLRYVQTGGAAMPHLQKMR